MKFIGIGKIKKDQNGKVAERKYIVEMTEVEADKITGVAGKPHISGRYKPGMQINISAIYDKVERINKRHTEIKAAAIELQADAADMVDAIPLT